MQCLILCSITQPRLFASFFLFQFTTDALPDSVASILRPPGIQVDDFKLSVTVVRSSKQVSVSASGKLQVGNAQLDVSLTFSTVDKSASLSVASASEISIADLSGAVLGDQDASQINFLSAIRASSASFRIEYLSGSLKDFSLQVSITSLGSFFSSLGGDVLPTGPIQSALKAAKLDSFDLRDVALSFVRKEGVYSLQVSAKPVLAALADVTSTVDILAEDFTSKNLRIALAFSVSDMM